MSAKLLGLFLVAVTLVTFVGHSLATPTEAKADWITDLLNTVQELANSFNNDNNPNNNATAEDLNKFKEFRTPFDQCRAEGGSIGNCAQSAGAPVSQGANPPAQPPVNQGPLTPATSGITQPITPSGTTPTQPSRAVYQDCRSQGGSPDDCEREAGISPNEPGNPAAYDRCLAAGGNDTQCALDSGYNTGPGISLNSDGSNPVTQLGRQGFLGR